MEPASIFINYEEFLVLHRLMFLSTASRLKRAAFLAHDIIELSGEVVGHSLLKSRESCLLACAYHQQVLAWRSAAQAPLAVTLTFEILPAFAGGLSPAELGLCLVRGLNRIVDASQSTRLKLSFRDSLLKMGFPRPMADVVSQTRHSLTHSSAPPADFLRASAAITLCFLKFHFWDANLRAHSRLFVERRLAFTLNAMNGVLGGQLRAEDFKPLRARRPAAGPPRGDAAALAAALNSEDCEATGLGGLARRLRLRKVDFLCAGFDLALSGALRRLGPLVSYLEQSVTVADFRNAFAAPRFREQVYRVVCERDVTPAAAELFAALQGFKRVLFTSPFVEWWEAGAEPPAFDLAAARRRLELPPIAEALKHYYL